MSLRLVILDPMPEAGLARFSLYVPEGFTLATSRSRSAEDQLAAIADADFAITGDVPVTADMIRAGAAARLKAVQKWGVGYDNIDLEAARQRGVRVMRTTGSNAVAVAETALGLILSLGRNIVSGHVGLHEGRWLKGALGGTSRQLTGKTVGLIGLGYIGKQLARFLRGFSCTVLYYKRTPLSPVEERELGVRYAPLDEVIATSDIISLHCALSKETEGLIDKTAIERMKEGAFVVNTARGGLVVEDDLAEAVRSGRLGGAAVDVYSVEPIGPDHPFLEVDRMIVTPHIGAMSADAYAGNVERMLHNILCVAEGREPPELDVLV
ncbi:NAD-binding D-isomer specific 2-hydroxyacid dehydrogenase [Acetobacter nitrogenifigens DSM 23921 = NBRC 105050]|uniref:Dehydrogenase n=1 Tax=Acetobacter nitrogenifigens DSM 23921 = NBRC 105050 TaxID=1120919 RepID=A0A511XC65_9PROT|nr:2-hydroxyacid dehydrogenase [Acetobacter nitrogenifigens]GBQ94145.1 NAD-binding D-isomer specific 2-hydroxyacid dehydrogenase [Acetobacter nitrogenifigens DSM 23921 = NBRC 105050]GEN60558.1 dehydrogenase [Acetobacter nitrogenifigens DSM 23921 = NBRC 105050]